MSSKEQTIKNNALDSLLQIERLLEEKYGDDYYHLIANVKDALVTLESETLKLDWLLSGPFGINKYISLSQIDETYDEKITVKSRKCIEQDNNFKSFLKDKAK